MDYSHCTHCKYIRNQVVSFVTQGWQEKLEQNCERSVTQKRKKFCDTCKRLVAEVWQKQVRMSRDSGVTPSFVTHLCKLWSDSEKRLRSQADNRLLSSSCYCCYTHMLQAFHTAVCVLWVEPAMARTWRLPTIKSQPTEEAKLLWLRTQPWPVETQTPGDRLHRPWQPWASPVEDGNLTITTMPETKCDTEDEDAQNLIARCPAYARQRLKHLGKPVLDEEWTQAAPSAVSAFLEATQRLSEIMEV